MKRLTSLMPRIAANTLGLAVATIAGGGAIAEERGYSIEEIVVTAQKREQNLQDVGIAVSAFTGDALKELGAQSLSEVPNFTPNVELFDEYGSGQPTWVIRGVGLQDFNANNTPAAAIYVDDIYMTSNAMGGLGLFDIERIEILKGPQGALYGRNTSGGAVRVMSARPSTEAVDGYVSGSYGRWDEVTFEGAANLPLSDSAALRLAGRWNQSNDAWQKSLSAGEHHGEKDTWAARAQLLVELDEDVELLVKVHGARDNSETVMGRSVGLYDPATGDFCDALLSGRRDDNSCVNLATLTSFFFGDLSAPFPSAQSDDGADTLSDPVNQLDNKAFGTSAALTVEFDAFTLTSITGFEDFEFSLAFDYDGGQGEFGHQLARSDIEAWSQEFRLVSHSDGDVNWLLGLEYAEDKFSENRDFLLADNLLVMMDSGLGAAGKLQFDQDTESLAVYGQVEWQFADTWRLTLGARYTDEEKTYRDGSFNALLFGMEELGQVPLVENLNVDFDMQVWSGKAGLDWTPAEDLLVYASVSRGFKAGGFYGGFPNDGLASIEPYDEETVWAYELGFKSEWLNNTLRLNGALFFYDYTDVQGFQTRFSTISNTVVTSLGNQGDAEHQGAELELLWLPSEQLTIQAGISVLEAEINDSDAVSTNLLGEDVPLEGLERAYSPDLSYSLMARYEWPLADNLSAVFQVDYSYRDDVAGDALSVPEQALYGGQDGYGLFNTRVALGAVDGEWTVALWGKNLADEEYITNVTTDDLGSYMDIYGRPRSYGVDVTYRW